MSNYIVRPGDTLSKIAARFGTNVMRLASDNNIDDPDVITVGQSLVINTAAAQPVTVDAAGNLSVVNADGSNIYTMPEVLSLGTAYDWREWLKPPKVYYLLGALAIGVYILTDKRR